MMPANLYRVRYRSQVSGSIYYQLINWRIHNEPGDTLRIINALDIVQPVRTLRLCDRLRRCQGILFLLGVQEVVVCLHGSV